MAAAVSVFFWRMQPSGLNQSDTCQLANAQRPSHRALQFHSEIGYLLKNRNFGCFVGPCNCMAAAVSVFFWRMQPSGLNQSDTCQLGNVKDPVAEPCISTVKLVIYLKIATLAASYALVTAWQLRYQYFFEECNPLDWTKVIHVS